MRDPRLAVIHVAKKQCGLDEDAYRALLVGAAGVSSAADIRSDTQFEAVMVAFKALGFEKNRKLPSLRAPAPDNPQKVTQRQFFYIQGLWALASKAKDEASLRTMTKRIGGVDDPRFLDRRGAAKVIQALRAIAWKAGFNPDSASKEPRS